MGNASSASYKRKKGQQQNLSSPGEDQKQHVRSVRFTTDSKVAPGHVTVDGKAKNAEDKDFASQRRVQFSQKDNQFEVSKKSVVVDDILKEDSNNNGGSLKWVVEEQSTMSSESLVQELQIQVKALQKQLQDKNEVIRSLERQLNTSRRDRDVEVTGVKQSVEMVIKEKDSEIRRLRALWSPDESLQVDVVDAALVTDLSRATKLLNVPEMNPEKANARFGISAENRSSSMKILRYETKSHPKTPEESLFIRKALNKNVFLKGLNSSQVDQLIDCMTKKVYSNSSNVVTEGEFGTQLFVLKSGTVEVFHSKGTERDHVIDLRTGDVFGELAILYNCKRTASVRAQTDVSVWCLDRQDFQAIVKKIGHTMQTEYVRLLKTVEKLKSLPESKLMRIANCLEESTFSKGEYIIRQGESGDTFYIIQKGKVKVTHTKAHVQKKKKIYTEEFVCHLDKGKYFGETALLTEEKRSANIIADSSTVQVLMLDRLAFISLVGSITDINLNANEQETLDVNTDDSNSLQQLSIRDDDEEEEEDEWSEEEDLLDVVDGITPASSARVTTRLSRAISEKIKVVPLEKLNTIQILGQGGFGCVKLVSVPGLPQHAFALKAIRKARIIKTGQQQHILAEKNILLDMRSNFIGRLHRTYKDELRVYLLMDAYLGGDLYGILKKVGPLSDMIARFYAGCVLEALEYLHLRGIVYRDMKPENLMLDHNGYVKLVDFGFAKRLRYGYKTYTFCGTPEYFPPEIISNTGHDFAADYWSYGILIYELLTRQTPFYAENDMTVYENILGGLDGVRLSKRISKNAEILIRGLCRLEPRDRLGYQRGGIGDIRKQRWFQSFDWIGLRNYRVPPPFDLDVRGPTDTRNFENVNEKSFDKNEDRKIIKNANMAWVATF